MKKAVSILIVTVGIMLALISISLNISNLTVTDESIVLVFVGILATFVVVGNYAQVLEIQNNTKYQINDLKKEIDYKIEEIDKLKKEVLDTKNNLSELSDDFEIKTTITFLLHAKILQKSKSYRFATLLYINSFDYYIQNNSDYEDYSYVFDLILKNLKDEFWDSDRTSIDYNANIKKIKALPETCRLKHDIVKELERQQKRDKNVKEENNS